MDEEPRATLLCYPSVRRQPLKFDKKQSNRLYSHSHSQRSRHMPGQTRLHSGRSFVGNGAQHRDDSQHVLATPQPLTLRTPTVARLCSSCCTCYTTGTLNDKPCDDPCIKDSSSTATTGCILFTVQLSNTSMCWANRKADCNCFIGVTAP